MSVRKVVRIDGVSHMVEVHGRDAALAARVDDAAFELAVARPERDPRAATTWRVTRDGRSLLATVVRERDTVWIALDGEIHRCTIGDETRVGGAAGGARAPQVTAPMPGKVLAVRVAAGQTVAAGDPLVVLEAMKMETIVSAEGDARVREVHVADGATIEPGQVLVVLDFDA